MHQSVSYQYVSIADNETDAEDDRKLPRLQANLWCEFPKQKSYALRMGMGSKETKPVVPCLSHRLA